MDIKNRKEKIEIAKHRYYKQLGENLKSARIAAGVTQKDVANFLNLSPVTISRYESGDRSPDLSTMVSLAFFYNVKLYDLLKGCDPLDESVDCVFFHDDNSGNFYFLFPDEKRSSKKYNVKKRKLCRQGVESLEHIAKSQLENLAIESLVRLNNYGYAHTQNPKIIDNNTGVAYSLEMSDLIKLLNSTLDYFNFNLNSILERSAITVQPPEKDIDR